MAIIPPMIKDDVASKPQRNAFNILCCFKFYRLYPLNHIIQDPFSNQANQDPFLNQTNQDPFSNQANQDPFLHAPQLQ